MPTVPDDHGAARALPRRGPAGAAVAAACRATGCHHGGVTRRRLALACLLLSAVLAASCGGSSSKSNDETAATPTPTSTATPTPTPTAAAKKPKVKVPHGKPPKHLVKRDLKVGTGQPAQAGQQVTVQYVGVDYKNGKQFDASWDRGQPFSFPLGAGQVIPGWDRGVAGMRVGGRRQLTIPPDLGYGASGTPDGTIPPNATLVFVVDLKKVSH
jgi:peptidylprolyl isomerase